MRYMPYVGTLVAATLQIALFAEALEHVQELVRPKLEATTLVA